MKGHSSICAIASLVVLTITASQLQQKWIWIMQTDFFHSPRPALEQSGGLEADIRDQVPSKVSSFAKCILYDQPPRTGSTTIGISLDKCVRSKGYSGVPATKHRGRDYVIDDMLEVQGKLKASVQAHLFMTRRDIRNLHEQCDKLLYISSTVPMADRLLSVLKYATYKGHGNRSISPKALKEMFEKRLPGMTEVETFLEAYPFKAEFNIRESERLVPSYVIRRDFLKEDTMAILNALGCNHVNVSNENVHVLEGATDRQAEEQYTLMYEMKATLSAMMRRNDSRYKILNDLAEKNEDGLQLASSF